MKKIIIYLCLIVFSQSCAEFPKIVNKQSGFFEKVSLGVKVQHINKQIVVTEVTDPAREAGIIKGDIIKAIDKVIIEKRRDILQLLENKNPGDICKLTVERKKKHIDIDIRLTPSIYAKDIFYLKKLLWDEKDIKLIVHIDKVINTQQYKTRSRRKEWKKAMSSKLLQEYENYLVNIFGDEDNFKIIKRERVEDTLNGQTFGFFGTFSEKQLAEIGWKVLGGTHLWLISFSRFTEDRNNFHDIIERRLIDIKTGEALTKVRINADMDMEKVIEIFKADTFLETYIKPYKEKNREEYYTKNFDESGKTIFYTTLRNTRYKKEYNTSFDIKLYFGESNDRTRFFRLKTRYTNNRSEYHSPDWMFYKTVQLIGDNGARLTVKTDSTDKQSYSDIYGVTEWSDDPVSKKDILPFNNAKAVKVIFSGRYTYDFMMTKEQLTAFKEMINF